MQNLKSEICRIENQVKWLQTKCTKEDGRVAGVSEAVHVNHKVEQLAF